MALTLEIGNTGDPNEVESIKSALQQAYRDSLGDWTVKIVLDPSSDNWELRIFGPQNYRVPPRTLFGGDGGHKPEYIAALFRAE